MDYVHNILFNIQKETDKQAFVCDEEGYNYLKNKITINPSNVNVVETGFNEYGYEITKN